MDPNNSQAPSVNPDLQKLEDDLKNLQATPSGETPLQTPLEPVSSVPNDFVVETPPPPVKKSSAVLIIAVILMIIAVASAGAYFLIPKYFGSGTTPIACTMEAKICPDGSSVGRTGPNCEFDVCPDFIPVSTLVPTPEVTPVSTISATIIPTSTPTSSPSASPVI
ncbi:MAG: hypothetical protein AAB622_01180 [Patescibacteria group bacterium]